MPIDITALDYHALADLKDRILARMQEMRQNGVEALRAKFAADAAALGLVPEDVLGLAKKPRRKRRSTKHDANVSDT